MSALDALAALALATCPQGTSEATLRARSVDVVPVITLQCLSQGESEASDLPAESRLQMQELANSLREEMAVPGRAKWDACTLTVASNGEVSIEVEYPPSPETGL